MIKGKDKAFVVFEIKEFTLVKDCFIPIASLARICNACVALAKSHFNLLG